MASEPATTVELEEEQRQVEEAQAGNLDAMRPILERYAQPLYGTVILPRLGDAASAEEVLRATLAAFGDDPARAEVLETFVRPELGRALLGQRRVAEAFAVLDPLVAKDPADARRPGAELARDWCRAVAGWVETGAGSPSPRDLKIDTWN